MRISAGDIVVGEAAAVDGVVVVILAAPPPRGNVAADTIVVPMLSGLRFNGGKVWHTLDADDDGRTRRERHRMV